MLLFADQQFT